MPRAMPLSDAIDNYLAHLRAKGMATNTVKNQRQILHRALACWGNLQVQNIQPRHIDRLFAENAWSASTRNLYLGYLRSFFAWSRNQGVMGRDFDPTHGWRSQRVIRRDKMRLPMEEFYPLLDACEHPRDRAAVALGLFTFQRGSELQLLRVSDLDLKGDALHVFRPKTREEDILPVSSELAGEMETWLDWYRRDQGILQPHWYLLPSKKPDEWHNVNGVLQRTGRLSGLRPTQRMSHPYRAAQRALRALGYETKGEGEHTLRRSGARALADTLRDQGYDGALLRVASMLGHKDVKVTQLYIGWELERDQRNASIAGKPLFPGLQKRPEGRVIQMGGS